MARTSLEQAAGLTAADVVHKRFSTLPVEATVDDVRAWFAASSHRRMAFLASQGRYAGSLTAGDLAGDGSARFAVQLAHLGPVVAPDAPAKAAYELAVATEAHRVPVVDGDGMLVGVVGVTDDLAAFCGTSS